MEWGNIGAEWRKYWSYSCEQVNGWVFQIKCSWTLTLDVSAQRTTTKTELECAHVHTRHHAPPACVHGRGDSSTTTKRCAGFLFQWVIVMKLFIDDPWREDNQGRQQESSSCQQTDQTYPARTCLSFILLLVLRIPYLNTQLLITTTPLLISGLINILSLPRNQMECVPAQKLSGDVSLIFPILLLVCRIRSTLKFWSRCDQFWSVRLINILSLPRNQMKCEPTQELSGYFKVPLIIIVTMCLFYPVGSQLDWIEKTGTFKAGNYGSKIFRIGRRILFFREKTAFYGSLFLVFSRRNG